MDNNNENNIPKNRQSSRKKRNKSSTDGKENTPKNKKVKAKKRCPTDGIAISKQLAMKKQKSGGKIRSANNVTKKICPNGKPMPSLADLEKMFEDTDTEEQSPKPDKKTSNTPTKKTTSVDENKLLSPTTVSKIAEHMMELIKSAEPTALLAQVSDNLEPDTPPPPVVPPKKRKRPDVAYIVGCKERPYVPYKPCTSFCKGDDDYGVDNNTNNSDEEDQLPRKRGKKSKVGGFSKSIFNAQTDEIVERLKAIGEGDKSSDNSNIDNYAFKPFIPANQHVVPIKSTDNNSDDSCDSNKTVDYSYRNLTVEKVGEHLKANNKNINGDESDQSNKTDVYDFNASLSANGKPVTFSPLPSTSKDNETFVKNDKLLNESLNANNSIHETANDDLPNVSFPINSTIHKITDDKDDNDVQIVEPPCETIIVDDDTNNHSSEKIKKKYKCSKISGFIGKKSPSYLNDDDCVILVDDNSVKKYKENTSEDLTTIIIDDEYPNIDIEDVYKENVDEIIDIDSLIEENDAIIKRMDRTKRFDSVIEVVEIPNTPSPGIQQPLLNTSIIWENSSNYSEPRTICYSSNIEPVNTSVIYDNTSNYSEPRNIYDSSNTEPVNTSVINEHMSDYSEPRNIYHSTNTKPVNTSVNNEHMSNYSEQRNIYHSTNTGPVNTSVNNEHMSNYSEPRNIYHSSNTVPVNTSVINEDTSNYSEPRNIYHSSNTVPVNIPVSSSNYMEPRNIGHSSNTNILNSNSTPAEQINVPTNMSLNNNNRDTFNTEMGNRNSIANVVTDFFRRSQVLNATNNVFSRIDNLISTLDSLLPTNTESNSYPTQVPDTSRTNLPSYLLPNNGDLRLDLGTTIGAARGTVGTRQPRKKRTPKKPVTQKTNVNLPAETSSVEKPTRIIDCPICMDSLLPRDDGDVRAIVSTICGHVFCLACLQAAIRSSGKRCPTCRKVLKGVGYHQLYL